MKILTGGQFRELDLFTIQNEPIASIDLMERASRSVADEILRRWPQAEQRIFVFAGPGGNGGDGLAVARMLAEAGRITTAYLFNVRGSLSPDCEQNRERLRQTPDATLIEVTSELVFPELQTDDIIIDALFGTGLSKPLSGGFALVAKRINQSRATIVSIDVPSGLMCEDNSFNDTQNIVRATLTLSLGQPKLAFFLAENQRFVGEVKMLDIGLSTDGLKTLKTYLWLTEKNEISSLIRRRPMFAHKGTMGHALLVSGSRGMAGASILAARAALRAGVGKLTIHIPHSCLDILQTAVPEAIVDIDIDANITTTAIETYVFQAVGIGPGIGLHSHTAAALKSFIMRHEGPLVLDADALNILAANTDWIASIPADSILTPHPAEFDRLAGHSRTTFERMNRARDFAVDHHLFVIIKGHFTQICTPTGDVLINPTGNPGMATAGCGDVLTGIITALLAQGYLPIEAAQIGVYLHGLAGDIAADELSEESVIASDIINFLPKAFKNIKD
ncbi:MAG: NAD(P)H-hydrate dehydratase [Bacteroidaceae bacterium]|nr:NAD(P)H-hydrate dehydratase [Bacteroidaceae bacterium]